MITYDENSGPHLANVAELRQMAARIRALEELICASAPLTWAADGDMLSASAWERRAVELLRDAQREGADDA